MIAVLWPRHALISQSCLDYNSSILSFTFQSATIPSAVQLRWNLADFFFVRLLACCLFVWWLLSALFRLLIQRISRALCRWNCGRVRFLCVATVAYSRTFLIAIPVSFELFELEHFCFLFPCNSTWIYVGYFHIVFISDVAYILRLVLGWRRRTAVGRGR